MNTKEIVNQYLKELLKEERMMNLEHYLKEIAERTRKETLKEVDELLDYVFMEVYGHTLDTLNNIRTSDVRRNKVKALEKGEKFINILRYKLKKSGLKAR